MKITDLLTKESIDLNVKASNKKDVIEQAVELMEQNGNINNKQEYLRLVMKREEEGSTGVGEGIAIPHGKGGVISEPGLVAMVIPDGVDFDALDGKPVKLLFLIAAPNSKDNLHLEVLSRLSALLMNEKFRNKLLNAKSKDEFLKTIDEADEQRINEETTNNVNNNLNENNKLKNDENKSINKSNNNYELLGITACPTGIAHTYMAAESLEQMGKELGHPIKIETQGQSGTKNKLTDEEMEIMKEHVIYTGMILKELGLEYVGRIAEMHHEKLDGTGYPYGLKDEEIPMEAKILAVADISSALMEKRPYKEKFSKDKTLDILKAMADDNKIDKNIVNKVIENYDYLVEICEKVRKKNNSKYNDLIRKYNEINNQYEELCRDKTES